MAIYKGKVKVDVTSYNSFKKAILNNAYDVDGVAYYQCYDLASLFWLNACNRYVTSKTADGGVRGGASGIWGARNENNKGNEFELITNVNNLKQGDVIITNNGTWGHICFLDKDGYVLGQNQGGTSGKIPGAECKIIKWNYKKYFLGAFRYKKWHESFLPKRGYFKKGDTSINVGKLAEFMYKTFPAYTKKEALGNYFGPYLESSIKEFQARTKLATDGCVGPITLNKLKEFGFKVD